METLEDVFNDGMYHGEDSVEAGLEAVRAYILLLECDKISALRASQKELAEALRKIRYCADDLATFDPFIVKLADETLRKYEEDK